MPADLVAVIKAVRGDPRNIATFDRIVKGLLREIMRATDRPRAGFEAQSARILDRDWPGLTAAQRRAVLGRATKSMETYFASAGKASLTPIRTYGIDVAGSTRRAWKRDLARVGPVIGTALTREDRTFVNQMAKTRSWYVKEHGKVLGEQYRDEAKAIIDDGAAAGLSGKQISKDLTKRMHELGVDQSESYFRVVADSAVSRSRTWSELSSFDEAGITAYRFAAVLDERTSDVCRLYHNKTWPVAPTMKRLADTERAAVRNPQAVKTMTPWIQKIRHEDGRQLLAIRREDKAGRVRYTPVAEVKRSAEGQRDKIGSYKQLRSDKQLQADGAVQPPLHGS